MKKRISIVAPVFPPYRGGIGTVAELDARQLAELGHDVHVYAPDAPGLCGRFCVEPLKPAFAWGNAALTPTVGKLWRSSDLVLLHYPFFGGAEPLAFSRPRDASKKFVVMYHMDVVGSGLLGTVFRFHTKAIMPRLLARADRVLVTSTDYAENSNLAAARADKSCWRELPPSVDVSRFSPGVSPLRTKFGLFADDRVILFVGGMDKAHYFKGVAVLLEALAAPVLVTAKAVLVGDGDLRRDFENLAARLGIAGRVTFAGAAGDAELPDYYRMADVLAFPSLDRSEAFGIVALEALACGLPVVASELPGVRTIVQHGRTGYLAAPGNADALARLLGKTLDDREARQMLGENGRRLAETRYSDAARLERWKTILAEIM